MNESMNWTRIYDKFELVFKESFNTDKKAHFDNMPDELKVIDGAKGIWCNLLMLDAIIYILVNDSFNSSSRRAFNQHKVLCECILDELEIICPESHYNLMESKRAAAVKGGKYLALSESLSEELSNKYSHLATLETMQYPWDSLDSLRSSLLDGPPSKAKNKFSTIMELLMNNDNLAQFRYNPDLIMHAVIHRVLFVFKNHKVVMAPLMSLCKKNKRSTATRDQFGEAENRKKSPKNFAFPVEIKPSYSITSPSQLTACIPVQLAATLIPVPMMDDLSGLSDGDFDFFMDCIETDNDFTSHNAHTALSTVHDSKRIMQDSQAAVEKAREAAAKLALLKDKRVLKKLLKAQKASQSQIPIAIQRTSSDHVCAVIPVLPLSLLNPATLDDLSVSSEDSADRSSAFRGVDKFDQLFDEETFNLLMDEDSSGAESATSRRSGGYSAVSDLTSNESSPRAPHPSSSSSSTVKLTINPSTTKYVLRDNILCAIVPVSDPKLIAAAAAVQRGYSHHAQEGDVYQHTPGGRNLERSSSLKIEEDAETISGGNSDTDKDSICTENDQCSLGPPLAKKTVFSAQPLTKVIRFNSLYADDDETAEPLSGACTQSFISMDTFESFVF